MSDELVEVDAVPDSAIRGGHSVTFVENDRLVVKWTDTDGTVYSEEYERDGKPKKAVMNDD